MVHMTNTAPADAGNVFIAFLPVALFGGLVIVEVNGATGEALLILALLGSALFLVVRPVRAGFHPGMLARLLFFTSVVFWYAYPAAIRLLLSGRSVSGALYVAEPQNAALLAAGAVAILLFVGTLGIMAGRRFGRQGASGLPTSHFAVWRIAIGACLLGLVPYMALSDGLTDAFAGISGGRSADKRWLQSGNLGDATSPWVYLASSCMIAGAMLLWVLAQQRDLTTLARASAVAIAFVMTSIMFFDQGIRSILALVVLPPIIIALARVWRRSRERAVLWTGATIGILLTVLQLELVMRSARGRTSIAASMLEDVATLGGTIDFFSETAFAFTIVPTVHDYFHESVVAQFLVSAIPRFLWPNKPVPEIVWLFSHQRSGLDIYATGGNILPGIVAQYYMSWSWLGVVEAGLFFGVLVAVVDNRIAAAMRTGGEIDAVCWILLAVWIAISFRCVSPGFFYPVVTAGLFVQMARRVRTAGGKKP